MPVNGSLPKLLWRWLSGFGLPYALLVTEMTMTTQKQTLVNFIVMCLLFEWFFIFSFVFFSGPKDDTKALPTFWLLAYYEFTWNDNCQSIKLKINRFQLIFFYSFNTTIVSYCEELAMNSSIGFRNNNLTV